MSKNKKHKNNPFSEENTTKNEITENEIAEEENNPEAEVAEEEVKSEETKEDAEEKKGIFDGLFKKNDEELNKQKEAYEKLNNQYLRLAADFDNYRKRQESEREALLKYGMEQALKKMIEVASAINVKIVG